MNRSGLEGFERLEALHRQAFEDFGESALRGFKPIPNPMPTVSQRIIAEPTGSPAHCCSELQHVSMFPARLSATVGYAYPGTFVPAPRFDPNRSSAGGLIVAGECCAKVARRPQVTAVQSSPPHLTLGGKRPD
jgi:hypothetical protein